jgi:hypothetical protein
VLWMTSASSQFYFVTVSTRPKNERVYPIQIRNQSFRGDE